MVLNIILPLCPVRPPPLLQESFHLVFSLPLHLFPGTGTSTILLSTCHSSLLLTCPYNFSLFSVTCYATGITFTDPLTCSLLILSFFVTPHIHRSILISFTSSLFSLLTMSHIAMLASPLFCASSSFASRASFCHTTLHCTSSNFSMLHSPYVLSPYPYLTMMRDVMCSSDWQ